MERLVDEISMSADTDTISHCMCLGLRLLLLGVSLIKQLKKVFFRANRRLKNILQLLTVQTMYRLPPSFPFILAGGHVRASAGALAVHTALIRVRVCVRACLRVCPVSNSFFITPRIGTRFVSVDR